MPTVKRTNRYSTTITEKFIGRWRIWREDGHGWSNVSLYFDNSDGAVKRFVHGEIYLGLHRPKEAARVIREWNRMAREPQLQW